MKDELTAAVAKAAPPASISGVSIFFGVQLDAWVLILSGIYLLLQIGLLLYNQFRKKGKK